MMNITSVNSAAVPTTTLTVDGGAMPLLADGVLPEGFSNALIAQLSMLGNQNSQTELSALPTQFDGQLAITAEALAEPEQGQDLAALAGDNLPVSYNPDKKAEVDANLAAVTDAINYVAAQQSQTPPQAEVQPQAQTEVPIPVAQADAEAVMETAVPTETAVIVASTNESEAVLKKDQHTEIKADDANIQVVDTTATDAAIVTNAVVPVAIVSEQAKPDMAMAAGQGNKAIATPLVKTPSQNPDNTVLVAKTETSGQAAPIAPVGQGQVLADDKTSFAPPAELAEITSEDKAMPQAAPVDLGKLEKLAVQKEDVPAMTKPLNHPDWDKEMGDRILWMNNKSIPSAEIKLNPQHLGPITVRIDVSQDQANVSFSAQHGVVRDALEASIPKLREMLNAQNINLADVNVAQHSSTNQGQSQAQNFFQDAKQQGQNPAHIGNEEIGLATEELENRSASVSKGLLSMYA